ncbi:MAG: sulfatase [Planctomycetaceae bacterium]|nr:sulfatase [Planctomycetaceae bacterium]
MRSIHRYCLSLLLLFVFAAKTDAAKPYNLLIIQTDEHHFSTLGCYGGTIVGTPHIDSIAKNGAKCTSFYATTPVCSPSRGSLVSGLYPQKTPVVTNNIPLDDSIVTFAEILKRNGYATGFAGKWHLDGSGKPQWAPERKFGFEDNRFMYNRGHWKRLVDTEDGPRVGAKNKKGQPNYDLNGADEKTFTTDWLSDKAIDFINKNKDQPFCYYLSLPDPHGPNTVRPPYDTMYADINVPIPVSLNRQPKQIPAWGKPAGVKPAQLQKLMRQYYGMVKCIDDNVGQIIETLKEQGVYENTIIVFTSDHGDLCGEHGRLNKGVPYEGSARIPFLITCPGKIQPGTVIEESLGCVDFLPTVLGLMKIEVPHQVDGRDASGLFMGNVEESWEDITFVRSTPGGVWLSAITARWKLVYSINEEPWLIDVQDDPNELTNLAGKAEHAEVMKELTKKLLAYGEKYDDPYIENPRIRSWMDQVLER